MGWVARFKRSGQRVGATATVNAMPVVRTYRPDERPDVEILVDGQ
jgi:hypothetical protein